jgi:hypothetical protein
MSRAIAGSPRRPAYGAQIATSPQCHGPVEGRTEPQLVPSSRDIRERASDQGGNAVERMTGIEPALSAWEADVLPLNYIRERMDSPLDSSGCGSIGSEQTM